DCACQEQEPDAFTSIIPSPPSARNLAVLLATEILHDGDRFRSLEATPPASESIRPIPIPIPIGIPIGAPPPVSAGNWPFIEGGAHAACCANIVVAGGATGGGA